MSTAPSGTSACATGVFFCANEGHRPELLLSSRVNDGLCDCCDGTDEYNGLTTCSNTCDDAGQQARLEAKAAHELRTQGYQRRLELEAAGKAQHGVCGLLALTGLVMPCQILPSVVKPAPVTPWST